MSIHQGSSLIATPAKQKGLFGIHHMQLTRIKKFKGHVIVADVFCGGGSNHIDDEVIDGSPITILKAATKAIRSFRNEPHQYTMVFYFSDIDKKRSMEMLPVEVEQFQAEHGLPVDRNNLIVTNDHGTYTFPIRYDYGNAAEKVALLDQTLVEIENSRLMLTIDPNGPKSLPVKETAALWKHHQLRTTLNLHISSTTLKRCAKAALATGYEFDFPPDLQSLIDIFTKNPHGWFRKPIGADAWVLLMLTRFEPKYGWGNEMYLMSEEDCRAMIEDQSKTKAEKDHE